MTPDEKAPESKASVPVEELLTTSEAMDKLGISRTAIRHAIEAGSLESIRRGRTLFVTRESVDKYKPLSREEAGRLGASRRWERHRQENPPQKSIDPVVVRPRGRPRKEEDRDEGGRRLKDISLDELGEFIDRRVQAALERYFAEKVGE